MEKNILSFIELMEKAEAITYENFKERNKLILTASKILDKIDKTDG
jgi:hypothetical protein